MVPFTFQALDWWCFFVCCVCVGGFLFIKCFSSILFQFNCVRMAMCSVNYNSCNLFLEVHLKHIDMYPEKGEQDYPNRKSHFHLFLPTPEGCGDLLELHMLWCMDL